MRTADVIYLSPHLDDAVLSCGGQIARQTRQGQRVLVVTICAGSPPENTTAGSAFVQELHTRWGLDDPTAMRRAEDLAALNGLQASALHLDIPDCIYRLDAQSGQPLYPDREAIFGNLSHAEAPLIDIVVRHLQSLEPLEGASLYVPLGVGHHVDHQLVRSASARWGAPGGRLAYYEDYPYAEDPQAVEAALAGNDLSAQLVWLEKMDIEYKLLAVVAYQSQLSTFFSDLNAMAARLTLFAWQRAGGEGLAERVWVPNLKK